MLQQQLSGLSGELLLVLARAVILGSESHGTRDHILLFQRWNRAAVWDQDSKRSTVRLAVRHFFLLMWGPSVPQPVRQIPLMGSDN
jgi:hypothetical protein